LANARWNGLQDVATSHWRASMLASEVVDNANASLSRLAGATVTVAIQRMWIVPGDTYRPVDIRAVNIRRIRRHTRVVARCTIPATLPTRLRRWIPHVPHKPRPAAGRAARSVLHGRV